MVCANSHRFRSTLTLVLVRLLSMGLVAGTAASALAQSSGTWATTGSLNVARAAHTATPLPNGLVLVAGGEGANSQILFSAELYDPATGKWSVTGSISTPRYGQVLVVGRELPLS